MTVAFDLGSGWGVVIAIAVGLGAIGGAVAYGHRLVRWLAPRDPTVSITHPTEDHLAWAYGIGGSDSDLQRQFAARERARLASLSVCYTVENRETQAVRNVKTGLRTEDGAEFTFDAFTPMLGAGDNLPVERASVPAELHEGMEDKNRAERFVFWTRFSVEGRAWEATYDPRVRTLDYRRLRRG